MPLADIRQARRKKLEALRQAGIDPYPGRAPKRMAGLQEIATRFSQFGKRAIFVVGRIRQIREHGGSTFLTIEDGSGTFQLFLSRARVGEKQYGEFRQFFDIGDFIRASGKLFKTTRGEKTLEVKTFGMLAKSLRPLPEKWHGLKDVEERLRRRYLDLLMVPEARRLFRKKSIFWQVVRDAMRKAGFLEVETPVLEAVPGGADAEPFQTHLNALDIDLYLRISLELPLKRLLVGGYEKVFEIGRIFRNEGIDATHLQDYTQLEFYWAYADENGLMAFVRNLYQTVIRQVSGGLTTTWHGKNIHWGGKWPRLDYYELFQKQFGLNVKRATREELLRIAKKSELKTEKWFGRGRLIDQLFKKQILPKLIQPAFLLYPPVDIEPLAKRLSAEPDRVARIQVIACGMELGKGFSELNDPLDQRTRFLEQMALREKGDKEAQRLDEDFVEALEYGMPPAAGFGMSERLFAVLMDKPVRETVLFPLMRPK